MCVERDSSFQNVGSVRVRSVQRSLNCALRRDAKQMQRRIEPSDWSMKIKMRFRYGNLPPGMWGLVEAFFEFGKNGDARQSRG